MEQLPAPPLPLALQPLRASQACIKCSGLSPPIWGHLLSSRTFEVSLKKGVHSTASPQRLHPYEGTRMASRLKLDNCQSDFVQFRPPIGDIYVVQNYRKRLPPCSHLTQRTTPDLTTGTGFLLLDLLPLRAMRLNTDDKRINVVKSKCNEIGGVHDRRRSNPEAFRSSLTFRASAPRVFSPSMGLP